MGVEIEWADLGARKQGEFRWYADTIVLSPRLTHVQAAATGWHEVGHRLFGDRCSSPRAERRAWEYAAAVMVTPEEYRTAEEIVGHRMTALALELSVTPKVIEAWRRWWNKRGKYLGLDAADDSQ